MQNGGRPTKGRKMRRFWIVLCLMGLAAVFSSNAGATQPDRFPLKGEPAFYDFPAGVVCPFHWTASFFGEQGMDLTYSNGLERQSYTYRVVITNVDTGLSREIHEAGTVVYRNLGGDLVQTATTGRELSLFFPGDLGPGSPGSLPFIIGTSREVDEVPGPNPNPFGVTTLSFQVLSGSVEDLCVTMA